MEKDINNATLCDQYLLKAKRIDNGEWVEGFYFCMVHDDYRHIHHFIMPVGIDLSLGTPIEKIQVEIDFNTICRCTGLTKNGHLVWDNDIVKYHFGEEYAPIKYGIYQSCFDSAKTQHCGFYVDWSEKHNMRKDLGYWINMIDTEIAGNRFDNPEFLEEGEKDNG